MYMMWRSDSRNFVPPKAKAQLDLCGQGSLIWGRNQGNSTRHKQPFDLDQNLIRVGQVFDYVSEPDEPKVIALEMAFQ